MKQKNAGSLYFLTIEQAFRNYSYTLKNSTECHDIVFDTLYDDAGNPNNILIIVGNTGTLREDYNALAPDVQRSYLKIGYDTIKPSDIGFVTRQLVGKFDYDIRHQETVTYYRQRGVFQQQLTKEEFDAL